MQQSVTMNFQLDERRVWFQCSPGLRFMQKGGMTEDQLHTAMDLPAVTCSRASRSSKGPRWFVQHPGSQEYCRFGALPRPTDSPRRPSPNNTPAQARTQQGETIRGHIVVGMCIKEDRGT